MKVTALLLLAGLAAVSASCPNDCNGHGSCNVYSACDCYRNWMGADCSERVCYFGLAFVDTPAGDLNTDGLISADGYRTRTANQDTEEIYPWYAGWGGTHYKVTQDSAGGNSRTAVTSGGAAGEAHFYKECANKGICNRQSGQCECFAGFTGEGCTRTACANDCSGHGTCSRMVDKASSYRGWDMYATQECQCDPGYFGADCSMRKCPMGDDPVTKYAGFTRITLQDKAAYGGPLGFDHYDRTKCPEGTENNSDNTTGNIVAVANHAGAYASTLANVADPQEASNVTTDWVHRIWSHDKTGPMSTKFCNSVTVTNCYGWNPWYAIGKASAPAAALDNAGNGTASTDDVCGWSGASMANSAICEQNPVKFRSAARKAAAAITTHTLNVHGTASRATGTMTTGGCDDSSVLSCPALDFWSLYLKDVTGTFQTGDTLRIDGYTAAGVRDIGFELCNYIKDVGTFYASLINKLQTDEEQVLVIDYTNVTAAADCSDTSDAACRHFEGYFALEFTDELGDTWMTEGIKVSGSLDTVQSATHTFDFVAAAAVDGSTAGEAATGHALGVQIQNALEALPNNVVPNVQVFYRPDDAQILNKRSYTIRFLENTGNVPTLNVAYSFTDTIGARKAISSNAECEGTGGSAGTSNTLKCVPYFGRASASQNTAATGAMSVSEGTATAAISMASTVNSVAYGRDGTTENVECSNRGICDYSTGICKCFTGFTSEDCSTQNSLAMG